MRYLKHIREQRGLSQDELARLSGVPQDGISRVERGLRKPHFGTLVKLARALGIEEPSMLALNVANVETFDEVINGSKGTRQAFLEYKRDVGRLESLIEDLEEIYAAAMSDYDRTTLIGARVQAAFLLGYIRGAQEGVVIKAQENEEQEGVLATTS
jgi:transcriptional regulator with XRE-family HTH domain